VQICHDAKHLHLRRFGCFHPQNIISIRGVYLHTRDVLDKIYKSFISYTIVDNENDECKNTPPKDYEGGGIASNWAN